MHFIFCLFSFQKCFRCCCYCGGCFLFENEKNTLKPTTKTAAKFSSQVVVLGFVFLSKRFFLVCRHSLLHLSMQAFHLIFCFKSNNVYNDDVSVAAIVFPLSLYMLYIFYLEKKTTVFLNSTSWRVFVFNFLTLLHRNIQKIENVKAKKQSINKRKSKV